MKNDFFKRIDLPILGSSCKEVGWLTLIAILPLLINIVIAAIPFNNINIAFKDKIVPGEILSYCMSFIAPSLYLMTKMQGTGYKLPFLHTFSIITLLIYVCSVVLYLIAKNQWVQGINLSPQNNDLYFRLTLSFLTVTIVFRIYSVYHSKNISNWSIERERQQENFNVNFSKSIK